MARETRPRAVEFGPFALDLQTGELVRSGRKVRLQGQAFQILEMLLDRPGEVVTREALRQRLWSEDTYVDFDQGLNNAIKRLRESLGDSADQQRYIETLPRLGYRFAGTVMPAEAQEVNVSDLPSIAVAEARETSNSEKDRGPKKGGFLRWRWVALSMAVLVPAILYVYRRSSESAGDSRIRSVVVLPFTNMSGDESQDYFADAMTEELTSDVGKISALRVISRTSAMRYRKTQRTAPEIAHELNVKGLIEGSVVRSGNRVRITAQLINGPADRHIWSESYERDLKDVLAVQSEIARAIAEQVQAVITPDESERLRPQSVNPRAYEAYMRGRFFVDRWTPEDSAQALRSFEQAAELDQNYALAYVGMAECYVYGVAGIRDEEGQKRGIAAATRALELKPEMGEAHAILGMLRMNRYWDFSGAEAEIRKGIALSPNYAPAHHWYSHLLIDLGRFNESLAETKKLLELDPVSPTPTGHLAHHYRAARQWDLAIAQYQQVLAMDPTHTDDYGEMGEAYVGKRMYSEGGRELSRAVEMSRTSAQLPYYLARLGYALAMEGDRAGAERILTELPSDDVIDAACVYAGLGNRDKSIALLTESYQRHTFPLDAGYAVEFDPLRSDPRFADLLRKVGLR